MTYYVSTPLGGMALLADSLEDAYRMFLGTDLCDRLQEMEPGSAYSFYEGMAVDGAALYARAVGQPAEEWKTLAVFYSGPPSLGETRRVSKLCRLELVYTVVGRAFQERQASTPF